jgi:tetratricopeptide (TPR) repeat protein
MQLPFNSDAAPPPAPHRLLAPTNILDGILTTGIKHHREGRLAEAERIYRRILGIDARHAQTLIMLGTLAREVGRLEVASQLFRAAIGIDDSRPSDHSQFGTILQAQGKFDLATAAYMRALDLDPNFVEALEHLEDLRVLRADTPGRPTARPLARSKAERAKEDRMNLRVGL